MFVLLAVIKKPLFFRIVESDLQDKVKRVWHWPDNLLTDLPNTVHSCSRQGVVAAWLTSERPGSVMRLS